MSHSLDPRLGIQRDAVYAKTLSKDTWRQRIRRAVRHVQAFYEQQIIHPKWESRAFTQPAKTLSTCLMTMNAESRIEPLLRYVRQFSDEVVVGVDSKSKDTTYELCQTSGLVDELFIIDNPSLTCNAGMETLVKRCHGDWILRLDDDEFPEPVFAQYKHGILASEKYTHFKLPRLHLSNVTPDATAPGGYQIQWINDGYLYPDYQMRLFKNDLSLLEFPGAVGHLGIRCKGPKGRINTANLIHLNLAMNPRAKREEKLAKYIQRLNGGWVHPVNEHALLFEDYPYSIQPYEHPDVDFRQILSTTVLTQRQAFATLSEPLDDSQTSPITG
ncbi:MAG: hypothetical protein KTR14_08535 [Vampirovibrio sp.]|nr:hypothetical protein [Vampirovibrio sp.]